MKTRWIGVDFDETLRRKDGTPIQAMVTRIHAWLLDGMEVRIVTARLCPDVEEHTPGWAEHNGGPSVEDQRAFVTEWCVVNIGQALRVQHGKSPGMIELWDDKVVRVEANTGRRLSPSMVELD